MSRPGRADVLDDWNDAMLQAIRRDNTSAVLAARNLAILHLAIFDAAISNHRVPQSSLPPDRAVSVGLAVSAAAHEVTVALCPSERAIFDALWHSAGGGANSAQSKSNSAAIGFAAAHANLEQRAADGAQTARTYFPSNQPGAWRRTPPFYRPPELPNWGWLRPFASGGCERFRPPPPPKLDQPQYTADFNEVKALGARNSKARTLYETETARFWSDFTGTITPPGHWNQIARAIADAEHLAFPEKARLLALVNLALADAGVVCWDAKYTYNFWRPVTAIRHAAEDGNPYTESDPNWEPLLTTPPFPEYVSGHSTFSGAAGEVIRAFFGRDNLRFAVTSDTLPGVTRTYESVAAVVEEIGHSRILGGIHFSSADRAGRRAGAELGKHIFSVGLEASR